MEAGRGRSKIAVAQMTSTDDLEGNFQTVKRLAELAKAEGCSVVFFPENFAFLGGNSSESLRISEPLDGPRMARYRGLARELGLHLSLGGFQERGPDPEHVHNTHVVVDDNGFLAGEPYRKVHLFDVDVPGGPVLRESSFTVPGEALATAPSPAGLLGLATCYDLRFPDLYRRLAHELGAEILLAPSAFTVPTGRAHWEVLLRARAIENQCYVVAAAQAGRHNAKRESYGHSMIVDPWGVVLAQLDGQETGIGVAEVDLDHLDAVRRKMPCAAHSREARGRMGWH